ncbi:hypothetical protein BU25DRAFT_38559 [Macroventuria anomochaeta]|uniref:Uncharacterized protein n=1 Tax=Macroventuria anomochaeta TaxID=301207 RepID=A0ACB6S3T6_9PLEO|nr:uncharacterized protein BU25DRAFT_38559 [Macroventuria anomochaeta]KAF2628028.1 hypothetical protein BU25DRAFT_38559 [Macroventuria anomochaeta]
MFTEHTRILDFGLLTIHFDHARIAEQPGEKRASTDISMLVVGAGIGGLTFAIDTSRKGHDVRVIECSPEGQYSGEIIMIMNPALHTSKKWPGVMERARAAAYSSIFELRKFDGTPIETHAPGDAKNPSLGIYRRKTAQPSLHLRQGSRHTHHLRSSSNRILRDP